MTQLRGQLLIASPSLLDVNFARSVVLIAEHSDAGAVGVILNRPSEATVADAVPAIESIVDEEDRVYVGGPVEPGAVLLLAEFDRAEDSARIVFGDVGFLVARAEEDGPPSVATRRVRVFAGHSGWGPGQLDSELEREDWIVHPAQPDDVFTADSEHLWASVLERKGGRFALLARMPPDPSVN